MIDRWFQRGRRIRRLLNRTRWTAKLLRRPPAEATDEPGLVILQIDGLPRRQLEQAFAEGRMPYLRQLVERGHFKLESFYSGLPSTTPAVQGEILFGQRCAVPAFQFLDRELGQVQRMFDAEAAQRVAGRLAAAGEPLLTGGRSYSNIYAAGAADARFCAETLEDDKQELVARPWQTVLLGLLYFPTVLRVLGLALWELVLALGDVTRGIIQRQDLRTELSFISSRVGVSIVLREYLRVMTKLGIEEGAPIIYVNFLGYDEHAHRRGPGSWFAHWVLKGVDAVIRDISRAARGAPARDYEVLVLSDHGQRQASFYDDVQGRPVEEAVKAALADGALAGRAIHAFDPKLTGASLRNERARRLLGRRRGRTEAPRLTADELASEVVVTALGPIGHVYLPTTPSDDDLARCAEHLVATEKVPLVLWRDGADRLWAQNAEGRWEMLDAAAAVLGADHPFLDEVADDLEALCRHPNAGDLVISGSDLRGRPMTFVRENGAHGSVAGDEVRGFALVPHGFPVERRRSPRGEAYLRGEDVYRAAMAFRDRAESVALDATCGRAGPADSDRPDVLRVMSYNVHSCISLDGKVRPDRVLQVIRAAGPDVIALQEVDANRDRSKREDQAKFLAEALGMHHEYYAVFESRGEQYGLAILSRWPMSLIQSSHLTPADPQRRREARGAMWVQIDAPWGPVEVINTHWGLTRGERLRQAAMLAGDEWLGRLSGAAPVVLCGDLNAGPASPAYRLLAARLTDVQTAAAVAKKRTPQGTFPSPLPLRRLDHILVNRGWAVEQVISVRIPAATIASDHLPVCADLAPAGSWADAVLTEACPAAAV